MCLELERERLSRGELLVRERVGEDMMIGFGTLLLEVCSSETSWRVFENCRVSCGCGMVFRWY